MTKIYVNDKNTAKVEDLALNEPKQKYVFGTKYTNNCCKYCENDTERATALQS